MAPVAVEQDRLDEARARVGGLRRREQGPNLRPRAVGTDQNVGGDDQSAREGDAVPCIPACRDGSEFVIPGDRVRRDRAEQQAPQVAPVDLGFAAAARPVEQDVQVLVDDPLRVFPGPHQTEEAVPETCRRKRGLAVVLVDIKEAALRSRVGRGLRFIHRRRDAVQMQDAGECEAAETGADDGDVWHAALLTTQAQRGRRTSRLPETAQAIVRETLARPR